MLRAGLAKAAGTTPLVYAATETNVDAMAKLAKLTISGRKLPRGQVHPAYVLNSQISAGVYGTVTLSNVPATTSSPILHVASDTGTLKLVSLSPGMLPAGSWKAGRSYPPGHERPNLVEVVA